MGDLSRLSQVFLVNLPKPGSFSGDFSVDNGRFFSYHMVIRLSVQPDVLQSHMKWK